MTKIAFIGAGSTVFARNLLQDLFTVPELHKSTIALMDIDPGRLADTEAVANLLADKANAQPTIEATTDLRRALDGADYAINMIQVGGYRPSTEIDFEIPKRYGLRQTIGDTLGIGGIMRALRTIPVMLDFGRKMEEVCPDVLFLNYTNPMAMLCMAMERATAIRTVGLCHSVQGTAEDLAGWLRVPAEQVNYLCAGINHVAFYLRFECDGEDLYPALRQLANERREPAWERVRFDVFRRFGYFVTESSEHFSEYVPWFIKQGRDDLIARYNIPLDEYPARREDQIAEWGEYHAALTSPEPGALALPGATAWSAQRHDGATVGRRRPRESHTRGLLAPGSTLASRRRWDGAQRRVRDADHPQYRNRSAAGRQRQRGEPGVDRQPPQPCCVEVPCLVDRNGVQPTLVGALPPQLAALIQTNINVQELTVTASLTGKREHVYQAAMLDPHTSAELDPEQICTLIDDLLEAHGSMIPELV